MQSTHQYNSIGMTSDDEASILEPGPSTLRDLQR
ncbi:serine protease 33, partial [Danaus plexippus plexippus]